MQSRYPSATPVGHAVYRDHELGFWRYSDGVEGGGCTIVDSPGRDLLGVLYSLDADDARRLLAVDGFDVQYEVRDIDVTAGDGSRVSAFTLRVNANNGTWPPPDDYAGLVTNGAAEAGLPAEYQERLSAIIGEARSGV
jgi:gamma-glutamylcyclotransferase